MGMGDRGFGPTVFSAGTGAGSFRPLQHRSAIARASTDSALPAGVAPIGDTGPGSPTTPSATAVIPDGRLWFEGHRAGLITKGASRADCHLHSDLDRRSEPAPLAWRPVRGRALRSPPRLP